MHNQLNLCRFACVAVILTSCTAMSTSGQASDAVAPTEVIRLFNGRDLSGLYVWLRDTKYEDPKPIFTVTNGLLRVSGDGLGYICTKERYRDYHLVLEYHWGALTWGKRENSARDSGLIIHCADPDGSFGDTFMAGIEAQMIEGGTGDILVLPGKRTDGSKIDASVTAKIIKDRDGEKVWSDKGEEQVIPSGRINWYGRDVDWKDVKGFLGKGDVQYLGPAWNRYEVICRGDNIEYRLNGVKVNEGCKVIPSSGKILLQTELAEVFVRRFELWPLDKAPVTKPGWKDGDK
ncbi:MAG: DUF1080 domain-containing protein [Kiritimatiellae bacterium]|nr:DUF1080 domain-containing protein [Kiritimatiellia bacterium]MDD5520977.1 DUF1080 domain-containing protein [Kiritimatiellia bacterium]